MENSYYATNIEQGYYITKDGMIVVWYAGALVEYPVMQANGFDDYGNPLHYYIS